MSSILQNISLAPLTSFGCGGKAQNYLKIKSPADFKNNLPQLLKLKPWWFLGSGTNVLITDEDLPGVVLHFQGGEINFKNHQTKIVADSGINWDELVLKTIKQNLWGIELMSGIPGTLGGALAININAYGQALADVLNWVEIYDKNQNAFLKINFDATKWGYKTSPLAFNSIVILRAELNLSPQKTTDLKYATALEYAQKHQLNHQDLQQRRQIILGTRAKAGSLLNQTSVGRAKTCGSFFKNPIVKKEQVKQLIAHDETNLDLQKILQANQLHGGQANRVSAAHIMLAAGFFRGQKFGKVRLHPSHVLKIENYKKASALEIYQTALHIKTVVWQKLKINLDFEVSLLGNFTK